MSGREKVSDDFVDLAEEYYELIVNSDISYEKTEHTETTEKLKQEVETVEEDLEKYNEDHPLHSVLQDEYQEKKERLENLQAESKRVETLRDEFPRCIISDFATTSDMLTETTIQSISHTLLDEGRDEIFVGGTRLTPQSDLERGSIIQTTKGIHKLAREEAGEETEIQEIWATLSNREASILGILASSDDEIGPTAIAKRLEEDVTKGAVSPKLGDDQQRVHSLTYKGHNGYRLSIVGEYIWKKWGSSGESDSENAGKNSKEDTDESHEETVKDGPLNEFTD